VRQWYLYGGKNVFIHERALHNLRFSGYIFILIMVTFITLNGVDVLEVL
jgi:hypothetical protein